MVSCEGLGNGGVQSVMMNIIRNLKNKIQFDMLLFTSERRYYDDEFEQYGQIFRIPNYTGKNGMKARLEYYNRLTRIYKGTRKILMENGPYDAIHCNNYLESAACVKAAVECGVKVRIVHSHSAVPTGRGHIISKIYNSYLRKKILAYSTDMIGCSSIAADYLFGRSDGYTKNGGKICVISNCIDLTKFDRSRYKFNLRPHTFIHVGMMGEIKNQKFVLDVFKLIHKKYSDAELTFIGGGNEGYLKYLKRCTKEYDLELCVHFLPHDADVPKYLAESEYMIFPSKYEGFALSSLEAQVMGVSVYASDMVPKEADIGRMNFLEIKRGADYWAKQILRDMEFPRKAEAVDLSNIGLDNYTRKFQHIYERGYQG